MSTKRPRGAYYDHAERNVAEAMRHAMQARSPEPAFRIASAAVAELLGIPQSSARLVLERVRYLLDAGEIAPDLYRRLNPTTHRAPDPAAVAAKFGATVREV